jgi:hypothetical protein
MVRRSTVVEDTLRMNFPRVRETFSDVQLAFAETVAAHIADPLCGFESTVQLYIDLLEVLRETAKPSRQARIPKTLPIYIFNGSGDPVSDNIEHCLTPIGPAASRGWSTRPTRTADMKA